MHVSFSRHGSCDGGVQTNNAAPNTRSKTMFAPLLMLVGTVISVYATLEFLRPVPRNNPFGL